MTTSALVAGLNAQGYDVELQQHSGAWKASVFFAGPMHSYVRGTGSARADTAWDALQLAAWEALSAKEWLPGT